MNTEKSNFDPLCNTIWKLSGSGFIFQRDSYPKHWIENTHTQWNTVSHGLASLEYGPHHY